MAQGKAICTCKKCGAKFVRIKECHNRAEADSFEAWAIENCDLCNDCYKEEKNGLRAAENAKNEQEYENAKEQYNLPTITGVSEKQTRYADSLRKRFVTKYHSLLDKYDRVRESLESEKFLAWCAERGITDIDAQREKQYMSDKFLAVMYVIRTTGEARKIIDATQTLGF